MEGVEVPVEADGFALFSAAHAATVAMCAAAVVMVVWTGLRLARGTPAQYSWVNGLRVDAPGRLLGALALAHWLAATTWWMLPERFDPAQSLPLHVCDLMGPISAAALLTGWRPLTAVLYFWALGLCTQAFATPVVRLGPLFTEFWLFWETHTIVVGSAVYVVIVRGFRPGWRDFRAASAAILGYFAVVLPIDLATGWNYGYVGTTQPETPTLIDRLGPWPWRLVVMAVIVHAVFAALWLPWEAVRRTPQGDGPARIR